MGGCGRKIKTGQKCQIMEQMQQLQSTEFNEWDSKNSPCCLMLLYIQNIASNLSSSELKYNESVCVCVYCSAHYVGVFRAQKP